MVVGNGSGSGRRRKGYAAHCFALTTALVLILISISLLYNRLTSDPPTTTNSFQKDPFDDPEHPLLQDSDPDPIITTATTTSTSTSTSEDRIDELDVLDYDSKLSNEEEILRSLDSEGEDPSLQSSTSSSSSFYFDHLSLSIRRSFHHRSIDPWDDDYGNPFQPGGTTNLNQHPTTTTTTTKLPLPIGSDDVPLDEDVRRKMIKVSGIEDALLLKLPSRVSPLREGWGVWFDTKSDFLRKDKMFKSNLELLNPLNNLLLQDPDSVGVTSLTRGDKIVRKALLSQLKKPPSIPNKSLENTNTSFDSDHRLVRKSTTEDNASVYNSGVKRVIDKSSINNVKQSEPSVGIALPSRRLQRWGYFPGLPPFLTFSNFMDSFFRKSKCLMRVFMVWNSPSWMFTIRHQRSLESLLYHHPDACVVIFSETIELDFFKDFVKDSFKVAVAMPNLEELLRDTPTSIFASVWHEWRRTRFYSVHYSELIRLAALYKYGGIYLDCDIILLKPISTFSNSVGVEDLSPKSPLNGAVMAFEKHSSFIMQCMSEFYSTYDDTLKRWNGAELLTRVAGNFTRKTNGDKKQQEELQVQPASIFFPITSYDIQRYLLPPLNDSEKADQDSLFKKITNESYTFHFWNSVTSALAPEADSLVARILNRFCIRCSDVL